MKQLLILLLVCVGCRAPKQPATENGGDFYYHSPYAALPHDSTVDLLMRWGVYDPGGVLDTTHCEPLTTDTLELIRWHQSRLVKLMRGNKVVINRDGDYDPYWDMAIDSNGNIGFSERGKRYMDSLTRFDTSGSMGVVLLFDDIDTAKKELRILSNGGNSFTFKTDRSGYENDLVQNIGDKILYLFGTSGPILFASYADGLFSYKTIQLNQNVPLRFHDSYFMEYSSSLTKWRMRDASSNTLYSVKDMGSYGDFEFNGAVETNYWYEVDGIKVLSNQGGAITDVPTGASADSAANATAINAILSRLRDHGLIAN